MKSMKTKEGVFYFRVTAKGPCVELIDKATCSDNNAAGQIQHVYDGWFYSNARANGTKIPDSAVRQFLNSTTYVVGAHVVSSTEFVEVLKQLGAIRRQKSKGRQKNGNKTQ